MEKQHSRDPEGSSNGNQARAGAGASHGSAQKPQLLALMELCDERVETVWQRLDAAYAELAQHARERPYTVVGAAVGLGFVLGGGLRSRLVGSLLSLAGRSAVSRLGTMWLAAGLAQDEAATASKT